MQHARYCYTDSKLCIIFPEKNSTPEGSYKRGNEIFPPCHLSTGTCRQHTRRRVQIHKRASTCSISSGNTPSAKQQNNNRSMTQHTAENVSYDPNCVTCLPRFPSTAPTADWTRVTSAAWPPHKAREQGCVVFSAPHSSQNGVTLKDWVFVWMVCISNGTT